MSGMVTELAITAPRDGATPTGATVSEFLLSSGWPDLSAGDREARRLSLFLDENGLLEPSHLTALSESSSPRAHRAMTERTDTPVSIVAMEAGARWPHWFHGLDESGAKALVQRQTEDEEPEEFCSRVVERVKDISEHGSVHLTVLACNESTTATFLAVRYRIASALARCMARSGSGELVLTAEADIDDDLRHELLSLAGALCDDLHGTHLGVRVLFSSKAPRSAVRLRAVVAPPAAEVG